MNSTALWRISEVVAAMATQTELAPATAITGISIDSREVKEGTLFFAILGDHLDGHDYVDKALTAGACAAVVARPVEGVDATRLLQVEDTLEALNQLGIAARARTGAKVIAITGSVGKTGTKEALANALRDCGQVHAAVASFNNHWGVPLTLARCPEMSDFGIFEIGMNHAGEITPLVKMVRPHIAIITNVAPVHLEFFNSVDEIAQAKAEIFGGVEPDGTAILNRDNVYFDFLKTAAQKAGIARVLSVGENQKSDVRLVNCELNTLSSVAYVDLMGEALSYEIGAPGKHLVVNSLGVLAAVKAAGGDVNQATKAMRKWAAPEGRGARHLLKLRGKSVTLIDEIFNANPTSMRAAIATLAISNPEGCGRRIAVLGDMLELGHTSNELHRGLLEPLLEARVDQVFTVGPEMRSLWNELPEKLKGGFSLDALHLRDTLLQAIQPGDVVMIKGSKGTKMGPLVDALLTHLQ